MKTKSILQVSFYVSIGFIFLLQSCVIYEPQTVSIPLMSEKNEVQLNGGFSFWGGVYGSVAFAPAQHVALQVYGSAYPENSNFQGAIGYCTKSKSDLNFEVYGGYGSGNGTEPTDLNNNTYYNADYKLYFSQLNIGQTNQGNAHIDYGFGLKGGLFEATVKDDLYTTVVPNTTSAFLIEPQAFFRVGGEKFKVCFQTNITRIFIDRNSDLFDEFYLPLNFAISLNFRIAPSLYKISK